MPEACMYRAWTSRGCCWQWYDSRTYQNCCISRDRQCLEIFALIVSLYRALFALIINASHSCVRSLALALNIGLRSIFGTYIWYVQTVRTYKRYTGITVYRFVCKQERKRDKNRNGQRSINYRFSRPWKIDIERCGSLLPQTSVTQRSHKRPQSHPPQHDSLLQTYSSLHLHVLPNEVSWQFYQQVKLRCVLSSSWIKVRTYLPLVPWMAGCSRSWHSWMTLQSRLPSLQLWGILVSCACLTSASAKIQVCQDSCSLQNTHQSRKLGVRTAGSTHYAHHSYAPGLNHKGTKHPTQNSTMHLYVNLLAMHFGTIDMKKCLSSRADTQASCATIWSSLSMLCAG